VRGIVKVVTAVADGDLKQNLTVKSKGEVAALAETINNMTNTLATFADQVTTVAREVGVEGRLGGQAHVPGAAGTWKQLTGNVNLLAENLTNQVRAIAEVATAVTKGDLTRSIQVEARGEVAELKDNINTMIGNLRLTTDRNTEQNWLKTNLARFTNMLQGQRDLAAVGSMLLSELVPLVNSQQGVIYKVEEDGEAHLALLAKYAVDQRNGYPQRVELGAGLIGQCALDRKRILVDRIPADTAHVSSILIEALPRSLVVLPVLFEERVKAVIALASLHEFDPVHLAFLEQLTTSIGIVLNSIEATMQTEGLLEQSQKLAIELQTRQAELQQTNGELELKARQLAERNAEVEHARRALEEKAAELSLTSKYKSEFLANMSHELRTPLNSILILGQQLGDNPEGNLTGKQVEFAKTIHAAGTDLLNLISDILDLSKIESGTVTVDAQDVYVSNVVDAVARPFRHEAEARQLSFSVHIDAGVPRTITTDAKRIQQVLKNLLSNAFKFTEKGSVRLSVTSLPEWSSETGAPTKGPMIAFEVADSGIGIPVDKQKIIFEAFQQADSSTSRRFGGTGLGLAISRELATLLGGEIQLRSEQGVGSTFRLCLPHRFQDQGVSEPETTWGAPASNLRQQPLRTLPVEQLADDRDMLEPGDLVLLIVEDDPHFARVLVDLARESGFKVLVAAHGADALRLATDFNPTAISLDVFLPDMLGWTVLSHLKRNPATRHIPVQMLTQEEDRRHGLTRGAFAFLTKPTSTKELISALSRIRTFASARPKRLLIIEDDSREMLSIKQLLAHEDLEISTASTGAAALEILRSRGSDCIVLDLKLPDISGFDVLEEIRKDASLAEIPVVVFTGRELTADEDMRLHSIARSVVVKGVESPERLLDETALFLHRVVDQLPKEKQKMLDRLHRSDADMEGRTALVVDDDPRNIFALSSVLERRGMRVVTADTGKEAIDILEQGTDVSIVLMDIMMPEMDGYQTIQEIRARSKWPRLPIIALTAKAMKGDREKCLEAGASDYLAKPVDTEQLLAALRIWLHR
ncbi:MAG TPA: response regulator, partial [Hyphomicrobiaceae bacterium]|nr:response regulator [Hyphomicrobiaceae bacterium]